MNLQPTNKATPFVPGSIRPYASIQRMLVREVNFPDLYDQHKEILLHATSDELQAKCQSNEFAVCIKKHTKEPVAILHSWARSASPEKVLALVVELLGHKSTGIAFTGCRITISVISGRTCFAFELFAKKPDTQHNTNDKKELHNA